MVTDNIALRRFEAGWNDNRLISVGLDPDPAHLPENIREEVRRGTIDRALLKFREDCICSIIASSDRALAYKPNMAFFEAWGPDGIKLLKSIIDHLRKVDPDGPIILDFKRGDIGKTNFGYVREAVEYFRADGITLNPYLGEKANEPFLALTDILLFFLCKTSNEGSGEFQDRQVRLTHEEAVSLRLMEGATIPLYQLIAYRISHLWNLRNHNCALVVGATYPEELAQVRRLVGNTPILAPGIGKQGGDLYETVKCGIAPQGGGRLAINASSSIMYAAEPGAEFDRLDAEAKDAWAQNMSR